MTNLKNDRLLRTIWREPVDATPIWMMRQAGRYLPEYRATRARAGSFINLCKTPELACEVTLQPLQRFDVDAAIIFSDILTIPDAMGLGLEVLEGRGPFFKQPLQNQHTIKQLNLDLQNLNYVYDAIRMVKHELADKVPLIGFCGSPWTISAYMIEGQSTPGFPRALKMMQEEPLTLHQLLERMTMAITAHLNAQIQAGADVVMLFDTWGGLLNTQQYEEFSLEYMKQVIANLSHHSSQKTPTILFTKGGKEWLKPMAEAGCDVVSLDWECSLKEARELIGSKVALQGNLNPSYLLTTPGQIRQEVLHVLDSFGIGSGHIFNLGHGITPDVPPEHVEILVNAVHELSQRYHLS